MSVNAPKSETAQTPVLDATLHEMAIVEAIALASRVSGRRFIWKSLRPQECDGKTFVNTLANRTSVEKFLKVLKIVNLMGKTLLL